MSTGLNFIELQAQTVAKHTNYAYQNKVISQTTMPQVQFVNSILLISALSR